MTPEQIVIENRNRRGHCQAFSGILQTPNSKAPLPRLLTGEARLFTVVESTITIVTFTTYTLYSLLYVLSFVSFILHIRLFILLPGTP